VEQQQPSVLHTPVEPERLHTNGIRMLQIAQLEEQALQEQQLQPTPQPDLQQEHLITIASSRYQDLHVEQPLPTQPLLLL
jgi:hypothetical protein